MTRGRVLVIEGDEGLRGPLVQALQARGYTVDACGAAKAGFEQACAEPPDCIVCNPDLPDIDGSWVARRIRTESSAVWRTPIVFLGELADPSDRAQALAVGADAFLVRPMPNEDVVAQVDALLAMRDRFSGEEDAPSSFLYAAIRGDLALFPLASFLMMLEMERRSGTVDVISSGGTKAKLVVNAGFFANTEVAGVAKPAIEVLREVLSWRAGRFSFQTKESAHLPAARESVGALVLEAMRLEDEKNTAKKPPRPA